MANLVEELDSTAVAAPTAYDLLGKKQVTIGDWTFPTALVASDLGSITLTPQTVDVESQEGTISIPNGLYEELSVTVNLLLPRIGYLACIFPDLADPDPSTVENFDPNTYEGKIAFATGGCPTLTGVHVRIETLCGDTEQVIDIPNAQVAAGGELDLSSGDVVSLEVTVTPLLGTDGGVIFTQDIPSSTEESTES